MAPKVIWLLVLVALYWTYSVTMAVRGSHMAHAEDDYFVGPRHIPLWVFVLAVTAASFSGWTFMGHPAMVFRDGFQYAQLSLYAIAIPLTGVLFLKRQWILGRHYGYVTPGDMYADYYGGEAIRLLTVVVALVFSIPYLALQFAAAGYLFEVMSDGLIGRGLGMGLLAIAMLAYTAAGGLRSVAYVDAAQAILLALGILATGLIALHAAGGWDALQLGLAKLAGSEIGRWGSTRGEGGGDYQGYFAIPGIIQATAGYGRETPAGGLWTGVMGLTFLIAMMGIQSSPAFTMWAFAHRKPDAFAPQQVWASALGMGVILVVFGTIQGAGAHLAGGDAAANRRADVLKTMIGAGQAKIVPAPSEPEALMALFDRGAVPLRTAGPVTPDIPPAALSQALADGTAAADLADRTARENAFARIGLAPPKAAELLAGDTQAVDRFVADNHDLGHAFLAVYRLERRALLPAALNGMQLVVTPLPSGPLAANPDTLVPHYFNMLADRMPFVMALLAVCAIAAMQSTSAVYTSTAAGILAHDLFKAYVSPTAAATTQRLFGRLGVGAIVLAALAVALNGTDALVTLGGIAVAYGLQMWIPLAGVTWLSWITRRGATWGLLCGLLAVTFTEPMGIALLATVHLDFWGRWPLTIHSAGWGMGANLIVCLGVSLASPNLRQRAHRAKYHAVLKRHAEMSRGQKALSPLAWVVVVAWFFFAAGPGAVIGNDLFGAPGANGVDGSVHATDAWTFGIPSLWAWQILFWLLGVLMIWFLAYRLGLSVVSDRSIDSLLAEDDRKVPAPAPLSRAKPQA